MKHRIRKLTSLLLSLSLISALTLPAAASNALGEDLSAKDTLLHQETQLSTNVFWSTTYSDLRTENLITYTPNKAVTPIVTYGDALTDRSSVADTAALLEEDGYRVVAGINGDFYNVSTGLPIGMVVTEGLLRSSDAGYYAIGFRADGSAILGKPGVKVSANLGYAVDDGFGNSTELVRPVAAVNKARTNSGLYLYTYDFNAKHTTGTTEPGINVVCTVEQGKLAIGSTVTLRVDRVEETAVTSLAPDQIVLSANLQADSYYTTALQNIPQGSELTLTVSANDGWEDVEYAIGALYCLAENGAVVPNLAAGSNPRTAVGQKADGTLVFYTIDGRKTGYSIGASLSQVGERLLELGCQTVLCLDGGGSTNLAVTTPDSTAATIINRPSETGRKVTNQVFLVASDRSSGRLDHFYVNAAGDYVLAGSAVSVTASGVDSNYIPMDASYTLSASTGSIAEQEDGRYLLTTPASGGDITVTASGRGAKGSTVVHAIRNPDNLTLKNGASNLTELTVTPGSKTALTAGAVWNHLPLTATNEAFTWSVSGDIGTVDKHGVFTASAPGTGNLTVSAGDKSLTIPVTVAQAALQTIEDFETPDTRFFSGYYLTVSRTNVSDHVQRGHYAGKLDYVLPEDTGYYSQAMAGSFSNLGTPYTALNLWVYGDGSGNQLSFLYTGDIKTNGIFGALANGSSLRALDTAFILASISAIIMGMITKVWNFKKALSTFIEGCTGMMEVLMILMLAWGIGSICSACGTSTWIVSTCESFLTPTSMCAIIFIAACLTSFSTGSSWSVFAIFIPIAVSLAISIGAPVGMAIGVVLSGGIFGDHCSPISDTTVMSSMGSSCDHIDHVRTQLPYALTVAGSSLVGYIVSGLMKGGAFVGLAITLVLICLVSFLLNKHVGRGKDAKASQDAA